MDKWICPACKGENTVSSKFCLTCGAPRFANFRDMFEKEEAEEPLDFSELKMKREPHGKLCSVSYSFHANGMMINSREESEVTLKRLENDEAELLIRSESGITGGEKNVYRVSSSVLSEIEEIADRENLPAWSKLEYNPDPRFQPTDYSSSSTLSLTYDNIDPENPRQERFSINPKAVPGDGIDVIYDIIDRMKAAADGKEPLTHEDIQPMKVKGFGGFMGIIKDFRNQQKTKAGGTDADPESKLVLDDEGYWICPECGEHNPGKFCANCGSRRPEA